MYIYFFHLLINDVSMQQYRISIYKSQKLKKEKRKGKRKKIPTFCRSPRGRWKTSTVLEVITELPAVRY